MRLVTMVKRSRPASPKPIHPFFVASPTKRPRVESTTAPGGAASEFNAYHSQLASANGGSSDTRIVHRKIASAEAAAKADADPPLGQLMQRVKPASPSLAKGDAVVYWMRMQDMRGELNVL
jgi:hypothetical protein